MIPYKWMDLTARDQTGVLLGNIHRKLSRTQNLADLDFDIFTVPTENAFLLTSWSVETDGSGGASFGQRAELNLLDAQGNTLSSMTQSLIGAPNPVTGLPSVVAALTMTGSPIVVIGPAIRIEMRGRFSAASAFNHCEVSMNGVLIPRGTMAFQQ